MKLIKLKTENILLAWIKTISTAGRWPEKKLKDLKQEKKEDILKSK